MVVRTDSGNFMQAPIIFNSVDYYIGPSAAENDRGSLSGQVYL